MARADRRRAQREARNARASGRRRSGGGSGGSRNTPAGAIENQLFFTRLRNQAKWAFALMVVVFGAGFAFLGVGSGGLDLGQLIRDAFGNKGGGGGTSISKAEKEVAQHPRDAQAYKVLANAYERKGRTADAVSALQRYVTLKPKDPGQLEHLGKLQSNEARTALQDAQAAYAAQQYALAGSTFGASPSSKFGQALGQDPITSAVSTKVTTATQEATTRYQTSSSAALSTFQKLTKSRPDQGSYFELARAAEEFQNTAVALQAYKSLLKLVNDPSTKRGIKARIAALQPASKQGGG
jgi:tetratricopeptide (TPR) repeat protein